MRKILIGFALAVMALAGVGATPAAAQRISSTPTSNGAGAVEVAAAAAVSVAAKVATVTASTTFPCGFFRWGGLAYWRNCTSRIQSINIVTFGSWGPTGREVCVARGVTRLSYMPGLNRRPVLTAWSTGYCA